MLFRSAEVEAILEETEKAVKDTVPAKYIKSTLISLEKAIRIEGINCLFDKKISEKTSKNLINQKIKKNKIEEVIVKLIEIVIKKTEDVLRNIDENCDEIINEIVDENIDDLIKFEEDLKSKIELLMSSNKGINCKLNRNVFIKNEDIPFIFRTKGKLRRIVILDELENENVF